jgi:hypothetical protein
MALYSKIRQYLAKIWFVGVDPNQQALKEFKSEMEMFEVFEKLKIREEGANL